MKKLGSQELIPESQQSEYVRTHPLTQDRIDFLQHMVDTGPPGAIPPEWVELHHRLHAKLLGFLFPDRALQQTDNSVASQYGRAVAWFRKGQLEKALAILDPLIRQEPKNPYFYELKGQMLFENGKIEESIPAYAEAVSLAPFSGLIRISYAHSLLESRLDKEGRTKEAVKQLNLALEKEKHVSQPHHMLAIAYGKLGEEGLSRLHLAEEALMQGHKDFAEREANLAKVNLKKGTPSYQRALDILEVMKKKDKKDEKKD
jgi:predicted Zn-dependent protease